MVSFQAVYRKIQELGLQVAYNQDVGTHALCRNLMYLPLLPHEHITTMFHILADIPGLVPAFAALIAYVRTQWIEGTVFTRGDWPVFQQNIRTNNDVERWQYRLNHRAKRAKLSLYLLCRLLYRESQLISMPAQPHASWSYGQSILLAPGLPDLFFQLAVSLYALELKSEFPACNKNIRHSSIVV